MRNINGVSKTIQVLHIWYINVLLKTFLGREV